MTFKEIVIICSPIFCPVHFRILTKRAGNERETFFWLFEETVHHATWKFLTKGHVSDVTGHWKWQVLDQHYLDKSGTGGGCVTKKL